MRVLCTIVCLICTLSVSAQSKLTFKALGAPAEPKVTVSWNKYYTYEGITDICKKLAAAHPTLVKLASIGKSYQGRDIWALTVTDFSSGKADRKPGFYIDGNIHSNEIQGSEVALYTAWYLAENFDKVSFIKTLLQEKVFYIVPTINPDARQNFMQEANTPHSPRSGMIPIDDDRDGRFDEDNFDDLDGDGHITMMRRKSPNGRYKKDPEHPRRMIPVEADEQGEYELLGYEGFDNDGDGRVNEDRNGYYDPNRDWAWNWQPDYVQRGAYKYPFSLPESKAVKDFVFAHPNIAGAQSYHNAGGMLLRGPGAEEDQSTFSAADGRVFDAIGKKGEMMLPGYKYMITYRDLYSVFGGEKCWFFGNRGIFTFTNELWTPFYLYSKEYDQWWEGQEDYYSFDKYLLFEEAFVPWTTYEHPQYGTVEIGGFKKNYTRANPSFLLEEDAHRNMAFTLFHAHHTPHLEIREITATPLAGGFTAVTAVIANTRLIPTHSSHDIRNKIERPDYISLSGAEVIAGMIVTDRDLNITEEQKVNPAKLEVSNIPGMDQVIVRWIVKGQGPYTVTADSKKGGVQTKTQE